MDNYQLRESLYINCSSGVAIYRAADRRTDRSVAIKFKKTADVRRMRDMEREAQMQKTLEHPNFCKLLESFVFRENEFYVLALVMELLNSDLNKEVNHRKLRRSHWREQELLTYLFQIVDALEYLQSRGVCHRDIKPHNIFLDANDVIKLGDFGATCNTLNISSFSIQGTPLYLSPLLRKHYGESLADPTVTTLHHSPYKSDVFSLGITMVHLAKLECPKSLAVTTRFREALEATMSALGRRYSDDFRSIVRSMLAEDEADRPDFVELKQLLAKKFERQALAELCAPAVRCIQCRRVLGRDTQITTLLCRPGEHAFCSRDCFQTFVLLKLKDEGLKEVPCPYCPNSFIPQDYIEEVFGSKELFQRELDVYYQKDQLCSWCRLLESPVPITQCRHKFCAGCIRTWRKYIRPVPQSCPKCEVPFNPMAVKVLKKDCALL